MFSSLKMDHFESLTPKYPVYFKKRVCYRFVENPKTNLCAGCQQEEEFHKEKSQSAVWKYDECTVCEPTDAYGALTFPGYQSKKAKYIRVENETNPCDMIEFIYNKQAWGLDKPNLILSVTGGAQKFNIPQRMRKAFKRGLVKAAVSTGAWIITGGTNAGVMRLVGEAVAEESLSQPVTVLGIATWGKIALRDQMKVELVRELIFY
jgi:transient receptor potential cation channel subfamily M protein 2